MRKHTIVVRTYEAVSHTLTNTTNAGVLEITAHVARVFLTASHIAGAYFDHMPDTPHATGTVRLQTQCHQVTKRPFVQISVTVDILLLPAPRATAL